MTDVESTAPAAPAEKSAESARSRRQVDYAVAIALNVVILFVANVWPSWRAIPYVTEDAVPAVAIITIAAFVAIALNIACLVVDRRWMKPLTELVSAAFTLAVAIQVWHTFPFDLPTGALDWMMFARVAIVIAIVVSSIALVVQFILLIVRAAQSEPDRA